MRDVCYSGSGLEHDSETGMVEGAHELFGDMHGEVLAGVLTLTMDAQDGQAPEPEPEQLDGDGSDEAEDTFDAPTLRCISRVLPSADKTRYLLVGEFRNIPRPVGATAAEAPSTVGFIAHQILSEKAPAVQFESESAGESSDDESSDED